MVRHGGGFFECAAILQIGRDPRRAEAVIPELGCKCRRDELSLDEVERIVI